MSLGMSSERVLGENVFGNVFEGVFGIFAVVLDDVFGDVFGIGLAAKSSRGRLLGGVCEGCLEIFREVFGCLREWSMGMVNGDVVRVIYGVFV